MSIVNSSPKRGFTFQLKNSAIAAGLVFLSAGFGIGLYSLCLERQAHFEEKLVELEALKNERRELTLHNERMHDRVEYLKTDEGIEEIAREKLGLVKSGEFAYAVVPPPPDSFTISDEAESPHLEGASHARDSKEDFGLIVRALRHLFGPNSSPEQVST